MRPPAGLSNLLSPTSALENVHASVSSASKLLLHAARCSRVATRASPRSSSTLDRAPEKAVRAKNASSRPIRFAGEEAHRPGAEGIGPGTRSAPNGRQQAENDIRHGGYLRELYIRDFALVEEQRVQLQPGFTVITGESGAGKSVLVSALGQILGATAPENCVRQPASTAVVEGRLVLSSPATVALRHVFAELGVPQKAFPRQQGGASELVLRREIIRGEKQGSVRSRSFINGTSVSQRMLREVGNALVDVNGQHAAQTLRDPAAQLALLDRLAGTTGQAAAFGQQAARLKAAEEELRALLELGDEGAREELQGMVDKVGKHGVEPGEERRLRARLRLLESRRGNLQRCAMVAAAVSGEGGIEAILSNIESNLRAVASQEAAQAGESSENEEGFLEEETSHPPVEAIQGALEHLEATRRCLASAEQEVEAYAREVRFSEHEGQELSDRLSAIGRLLREFRCRSTEELLEAVDRAGRDLDHWYNSQGSREEQEAGIAALRTDMAAAAAALSQRRRRAAGCLRSAVERCLADLAMAGCRFDVRIGWDEAPGNEGLEVAEGLAAAAGEMGASRFRVRQDGLDRAEFLLAAGEAEPLRPLSAVASGGERARVMLALKAAPAAAATAQGEKSDSKEEGAASGAPILVLDELDSGVGGRLGQPVGKMLAKMAAAGTTGPAQILCVSHLPQVAASAAHHLCVRKAPSAGGRVVTHFVSLEGSQERRAEIAAMGGVREEEAQNMMSAAAVA